MSHAIRRIVGFELLSGYALRVHFDDGVSRDVDLSNILYGELYGPLRNPDLFRQARLDHEAHTVVWPNGADFDPATFYDWPVVAKRFAELASTWSNPKAAAGGN